MDKPVGLRRLILECVARHGAAGAQAVAIETGASEGGARYALKAMAEQGYLVQIQEGRSKSNWARPLIMFYLSHQGLAYLIEIGARPEEG